MKTFLGLLLTAAVAVMVVSPAVAQDGLALMKVDPGARPAGMGGTYVSIAGDANASAYNPAGAAGSPGFTASFGHNTYWENIRLETGYMAARLSDRAWFHGGIRYAAVSDLQSRLIPSPEPVALFDAHDVSFKAGLAYQITPMISAGIGLGWFLEKIEGYRGWAFNVDLGVIVKPTENISLGASATNLGSDFTLDYNGTGPGVSASDEISLPTSYRAGGSYRYDKYLAAVNLVVVDDEAHMHVGAQADLHEYFSLRAGYMSGYDSKNLTAGASFPVERYNLVVDYAFVPYSNDLGSSHLFNLTVGL